MKNKSLNIRLTFKEKAYLKDEAKKRKTSVAAMLLKPFNLPKSIADQEQHTPYASHYCADCCDFMYVWGKKDKCTCKCGKCTLNGSRLVLKKESIT